MKGNVLARESVRKFIAENLVFAELYTDRRRPEDRENARRMREVHGGTALPLYLVLDADGRERARLAGVEPSAERFLEFLRGGIR